MFKNILFVIIFVSFLIVSNSCKKEKPEDIKHQPTEKTITLLTDNVEPGQIVLSQASEAPIINSNTKIAVNGQAVTVFDAGDNKIGFLMPVLPSGKVLVDYTDAGFTKTLNVTIRDYSLITNPLQVTANFTSQIEKSIKNLDAHAQNKFSTVSIDDIELVKYLNQTIKDNINSLTETEKLQLAYYLRANTPNPDDLILDTVKSEFILGKKSSATDPGEVLVQKALSYDKNLLIGVPTTIAGWGFAIIPSPTLIEKLAAAGLLTTGLVHLAAAKSDAEYVANLTGVADKIVEPFQKRATKLILRNETDEKVYFKGVYRTINQEDSKSQNSILKLIFNGNKRLTYGYNTSVNLSNKIISWFPWKTPKIPQYSNPIGTKSGFREIYLPGTKIMLEQVSSPEIKLIYSTNEGYVAIKASSEKIIKETDFTFKAKFTDDALGIKLEKQIDATFKPKFTILGKWLVYKEYTEEPGKEGWYDNGDGKIFEFFNNNTVAIFNPETGNLTIKYTHDETNGTILFYEDGFNEEPDIFKIKLLNKTELVIRIEHGDGFVDEYYMKRP